MCCSGFSEGKNTSLRVHDLPPPFHWRGPAWPRPSHLPSHLGLPEQPASPGWPRRKFCSFLLVSWWEQIISANVMNDEVGQYILCAVDSLLIVGTWAGAGWKSPMAQMRELGFRDLQWEAREIQRIWEDIQGVEWAALGDQVEVARKEQTRGQWALGPCLEPWGGRTWGKGEV